jgi:DNA-directed RNA polymerase specialized sigma24 family protein
MREDLDIHLEAIVGGDVHSFGRWLAGAEPTVRLSLRSFARVIDVEAVVQESLLRVWQVAGRFERDGKPNGLLRLGIRIARNLAVSEVRRTRAASSPSEDAETTVSVEPHEPDPLLRRAIVDCRNALPPKPRQALDVRLASAGGADDAELAESVGMKLNTFLQNFTRARQLLADCLRKKGVDIAEELRA